MTLLIHYQNTCADKTFSWKLDQYNGLGSVYEFKHQYRKNGIPCVESNGAECKTSRAFFSTVGLSYESSAAEGGGVSASTWVGPYHATIFSECDGGCGLISGNN